jgi:hypothetical protein
LKLPGVTGKILWIRVLGHSFFCGARLFDVAGFGKIGIWSCCGEPRTDRSVCATEGHRLKPVPLKVSVCLEELW